MDAGRLVAPGYLPARAQALLPWTRRYVVKLSTRDAIPLEDLWDEAIAALLRADVHFSAAVGTRFSTYACNSVIRGCWRYVARSLSQRRRGLGLGISWEEFVEDQVGTAARADPTFRKRARWRTPPELIAPSAEDEAMARERAHEFSASLASSRMRSRVNRVS